MTGWTGERARFGYMGDTGPDGIERPHEDPAEGCPAGWWRSPFVLSLHRYRRDPDDNGNRVANPFLDRCEDRFVVEAIQALESYEAQARAEHREHVRKLYDSSN